MPTKFTPSGWTYKGRPQPDAIEDYMDFNDDYNNIGDDSDYNDEASGYDYPVDEASGHNYPVTHHGHDDVDGYALMTSQGIRDHPKVVKGQ